MHRYLSQYLNFVDQSISQSFIYSTFQTIPGELKTWDVNFCTLKFVVFVSTGMNPTDQFLHVTPLSLIIMYVSSRSFLFANWHDGKLTENLLVLLSALSLQTAVLHQIQDDQRQGPDPGGGRRPGRASSLRPRDQQRSSPTEVSTFRSPRASLWSLHSAVIPQVNSQVASVIVKTTKVWKGSLAARRRQT